MRRSAVVTFFLLLGVFLLVYQIPGVHAQRDACLMSGLSYLPVDMSGAGPSVDSSFSATLMGDALNITGHGVFPSCTPGVGMNFTLQKVRGAIVLTEVPTGGSQFKAVLTRSGKGPAFDHLEITQTGSPDFSSATADLLDNNGDCRYDTIEFAVFLPNGSTKVATDSALQGRTVNGQNFVLIPNPILTGVGPMPGPSFYLDQITCTRQVSEGVYIPATEDYSVLMQCGDTVFGPVLRNACVAAVPATSGAGVLFSLIGIAAVGIWAMRKTHFGNTLAGS